MRIDIKQLEFIHPKLRKLVTWLEKETGFEFIITSIYRIDDKGVHGTLPVRGIDLRCRNKLIGKTMEEFVDAFWIYDKNRPDISCIKVHGKNSNLHIHLQVHDNTVML